MGWSTTTIRQGDTPQRLALRSLGSAQHWVDIVLLNGLSPPYFADTAGPGVLAYGGDVLLPVAQPDSIARVDDPFLTDLAVDDDGCLAVSGGDLATVGQSGNLRQALKMRVVAPKRSLLFHPEYGSWVPKLIGSVNRSSLAQLVAFYVQSALLEDPRVKSVAGISALLANDTISVSATVNPVRGEVIAFEQVF